MQNHDLKAVGLPALSAAGSAPSEHYIYAYLKGPSGQTLRGNFAPEKLAKLVGHFVKCEKIQLPKTDSR